MATISTDSRRFNDYPTYIKSIFGERVQKLSINAGFTCPNRDGNKGFGGCTYCNNQSFNPEYCSNGDSITDQLKHGISFFKKKYNSQKYLAYFQAYTNTYDTMDVLDKKYRDALSHPQVVGLVVGTRPDCVSDELLSYFSELSKDYYVAMEYGVESTNNSTLEFINRGHSYEESINVIEKTAALGLDVGAHLILGLPNENKAELLQHAVKISKLPVKMLKLHQLQIIKGTKMAQQFFENPNWFNLYSVDEYIDLVVDFLELLSPDIIVERFISQSPEGLLLAPHWGVKNFEFIHKLENRLRDRNTRQGILFTA